MSAKGTFSEKFARVPARIFWGALLVVVLALGVISYTKNGEQTSAQRAKSITQQLRCLECEGLSIYDSDTNTSKSIASDVARRVKKGETNKEIFEYYEGIYGEFIRLAPTAESGNWLIYVVPLFFVAVCVIAIILSIAKKTSARVRYGVWVIAGMLFIGGIVVFVRDARSADITTANKNVTQEQLLQQSVDESPNAGNYRSLALVQLADEKYVDALQNFDRAAGLDASDGESRAYAAYIVFQAGEYDQALMRAQSAVQADGSEPAALFFRGLIYYQTPTSDEAAHAANLALANKDFDAVLSLAPESSFASQIKELRAE